MQLADRTLGGWTGIGIGTQENERIRQLKDRIAIASGFGGGFSASDIIAAMLDAEGVGQGKYKEAWEDIPKQMGKPKPANWVPKALVAGVMEKAIKGSWGGREVKGRYRQQIKKLIEDMEWEVVIKVCGTSSSGTRTMRISSKQRDRLEILRKTLGYKRPAEVVTYLLDRAGMEYKRQEKAWVEVLDMLERETARAHGMMSDMPPITPGQEAEPATELDGNNTSPGVARNATEFTHTQVILGPESPPLAQATPGGPIESQVTEEPAPDIGHIAKEPT